MRGLSQRLGVGGAPSRLELNKASKEMNRIKDTIHRPQLRRISYVTIMDAVRRGYLPAAQNITRGSWMLPISPTVDAGFSNEENIDNLRKAGLESPQDLVAETNRDWNDVVRKKKQAANLMIQEPFRADANRQLVAEGYAPNITAMEISQLTDNPVQASQSEQIDRRKYCPEGAGRERKRRHENGRIKESEKEPLARGGAPNSRKGPPRPRNPGGVKIKNELKFPPGNIGNRTLHRQKAY